MMRKLTPTPRTIALKTPPMTRKAEWVRPSAEAVAISVVRLMERSSTPETMASNSSAALARSVAMRRASALLRTVASIPA